METTAEYITQNRNPICLGIDPGIGNTGWGVVKRLVSGYQLIAGYVPELSVAIETRTIGVNFRKNAS